MTDAVLLVSLLAVSAALVHALFFLGPGVETSMFRHALWRYRDELVDMPLHGTAPVGHPAVEDVVEVIEHLIATPQRYDLFWMLGSLRDKAPGPSRPEPSLAGLTPDTAARLQEIRGGVVALGVRHAALGTPLSAMATALLAPVVLVVSFRARTQDLGSSMRSGWGDGPPSTPTRPLSAHV